MTQGLNPVTLIDAYKYGHRTQYPDNTEYVYSNWTARGTRNEHNEVVFFGLQLFLQKYLQEEFGTQFFSRPVEEVAARYARRVDGVLGPNNNVGTDHIRALHDLGYIPLRFKALPEGSMVPLRVPMLTVENTLPEFAWLVNYFETLMSSILWMPCTSATTAANLRRILLEWAEKTGGDPAFVDWQGHDFSFRGMPGPEAAAMSGAGHLLSFTGTDTIPAIDLLEQYYAAHGDFVGGSVAATEHSVMCAGGDDNEQQTFQRLLELYPSGIVSVVSDTWDLWKVLTELLPNIKDEVMARDGKLVIRPDSGDPVKIIVGDPDAFPGTPAYKGVIELLWDVFGGTETSTGHRLLDSHVGAIYGDSINEQRMRAICAGLAQKGFASTNMVFGVGSFSYQYVTRDTYMFAMKSTWVQIDGVPKPIFKDPITDDGMKKSLKGRLQVVNRAESPDDRPIYVVIDEIEPGAELEPDALETVWEDGEFRLYYTLADVRKTLRRFL